MRSKNGIYTNLVLGALLAAAAIPAIVRAEDTRATYPEAVSVEILGRGVEYSVQFDRMATEDLGAGIGIGSVGTKGSFGFDTPGSLVIPAYINAYLTRDANSLFVTGGVTLVTNSEVQGFKANVSNLRFPDSSVIGTFGLGFESRSDIGFLLRATAYGLVGATVTPWLGITVGYGF